ncbi:hypothetical protein BH11BAC5_BH11BAC5_14120 [soil metagenome]
MAAFGLAGLLFFASCTTVSHIEMANGSHLSKYKTYGWVDEQNTREGKPDRSKDIIQQNIRTAVDGQLQKNGWRIVTVNPDVLVSADLVVEKNQQQQRNPVYSQPYTRTFFNRYSGRFSTFYYPSQFVGYDSYSTTVKEGTVTVTLIDPSTDKAVWQGWATNELNTANISGKEITKNVNSIFKKFDIGN